MPSAIEEASAAASLETPVAITPAAPPEPKPQTPPPPPDKPPERPVSAPPADAAKPPEKPAEVKETAMQRATAKIKGVLEKPKSPEVTGKDSPPPKRDKEWLASLPKEISDRLIQENPNAWRVHEAKASKLEARIKELESKPATPSNDDKIRQLEKQLADREKAFEELGGQAKTYQQRLAERDYTQSPEYADKFSKPWQRGHDEAYSFVEGLQVLDENGDPARQATKADFDKVMATPIQQRRQVAKALFGEDFASDIIDHTKDLDRIRKAANEAVKDHAENYQKTDVERTLAQQREMEGYTRLKDENRAELEKEFPNMFSVEHYKDQPEMQKVLADSYADYDNLRATYHQMSPEDRAANEVLARAHYAALPLMHKQVQALNTENESLKAELLKFRASDPGGEKPGAGGKPAIEQVGNIASMAGKFDE